MLMRCSSWPERGNQRPVGAFLCQRVCQAECPQCKGDHRCMQAALAFGLVSSFGGGGSVQVVACLVRRPTSH